jgi:hypothetical protein
MPGETKQIKFEIVGDARQLNQTLENAVRSMQNFAKQMAQATGGLIGGNVGGTGPVIPGARNQTNTSGTATQNILTRTVDDNKKILDSLKGASTDTLKTMADVATREIDREKNAIHGLSTELKNLNEKYAEYKRLRDEGRFGPVTAQFREKEMDEMGNRAAKIQQEINEREKNISVNREIAGVGGDGGGGPAGGGMFRNFFSGGLGRTIRNGIIGQLVADLVGTVSREAIQLRLDPTAIGAREAGTFMRSSLEAYQSGSLIRGHTLRSLNKDDLDNLKGLTDKSANLFNGLSTITQPGLTGWLFSPFRSLGNTIRGMRNMNAKEMEDAMRLLEQKENSAENMQANAELQLYHGMTQGMVRAERFMGGRERYKSVVRGGISAGFSPEESTGAYQSILMGNNQNAANALYQQVFDVMRGGILSGAQAGALAAAGSITGDMTIARDLASQNIGARSMTRIAGVLTNSDINGWGSISMQGMRGLLTGGLRNSLRDPLTESQNERGLEGLGGMMRGTMDPFATGINLLNARQFHRTGGIYGQRALATRVDDKTLANILANPTYEIENPYLRSHGITASMVRSEIFGSLGPNIASRLGNDPNAKTPWARTLRGLLATKDKNGNIDVKGYLKRHHSSTDERDVASILADALGKDFDTGAGMVREIEGQIGVISSLKPRRVRDTADATDLENLKNQLKFLKDTLEKFNSDFSKEIHDTIAHTQTYNEAMRILAETKPNAEIVSEVIRMMADAANKDKTATQIIRKANENVNKKRVEASQTRGGISLHRE